MNLHDTVTGMMIDISSEDRDRIELSVKEAEEHPDDFIRYMIVTVDSIGNDLNTLLEVLNRMGTIDVQHRKKVEDGDPSA